MESFAWFLQLYKFVGRQVISKGHNSNMGTVDPIWLFSNSQSCIFLTNATVSSLWVPAYISLDYYSLHFIQREVSKFVHGPALNCLSAHAYLSYTHQRKRSRRFLHHGFLPSLQCTTGANKVPSIVKLFIIRLQYSVVP